MATYKPGLTVRRLKNGRVFVRIWKSSEYRQSDMFDLKLKKK